MPRTTPAGSDDSAPGFSFPAIGRKKITAAFDGGRLTSDGGVLLLAQAERAMGLCRRLAACIADPRDPARVIHRLDDILRARVFAIACGYEDADDLDALRDDPGFRLALGKLPGSGAGLASQPTMSRWENAPTTRELARMMSAMIDIYCASYDCKRLQIQAVVEVMNTSTVPFALAVDDVPIILMDMTLILEDAGFRCHEAMDGDTAIVLLEEQADNTILLFSDGEMPGSINGFALARHVAQHWPWIEIVIASGNIRPNPGDMPEKATFIPKPFSAAIVHEHLRRTLPDGKKPAPLKNAVTTPVQPGA